MIKEKLNNVKLGAFVLTGLAVLIITLYLIGKNGNMFGSGFEVRARFSNVNGLIAGNNVRYAGIQAGTVSNVKVLNDSTIEVTLSVNKDMKPFIHVNSVASIGSDGLIGNKVIDISPGKAPASGIAEGGLLQTDIGGTEQIMQTLSNTGDNIELLSKKLIVTVEQLNSSTALWALLNDSTIPMNFRASLNSLTAAIARINNMSVVVNNMALDIQNGKGVAGVLLKDQKAAEDMRQALENINNASKKSTQLLGDMNKLVLDVQQDLASGKGTAHALLKDTVIAARLNKSMTNIEKGTEAFSQDMEALKHNILLRGYFRREARKNKNK